jgi:hypothetical protein
VVISSYQKKGFAFSAIVISSRSALILAMDAITGGLKRADMELDHARHCSA